MLSEYQSILSETDSYNIPELKKKTTTLQRGTKS